jgi:hypothetical protein
VLEGLPILGGDVDEASSKAAVQEWIAGLGLE